MIERGLIIRLNHFLVAALVAGGLTGCAATSGTTQSALQQDVSCSSTDGVMRPGGQASLAAEQLAAARSGVVLATEAGAGPVGTSSTPPSASASTPEAAYGRCGRSRQN